MTSYKILFHTAVVIATTAAALLFTSPSAHAKSFWDVFFGRDAEVEGPPPEETLQAPFSPKGQTGKPTGKLAGTYAETKDGSDFENVNRLENPNRTPQQIVDWGTDVIDRALTIDPLTIDGEQKKLSANFIPFAMEEYKKYLETTGIVGTLKSNNMVMRAISSEGGLVTRQGAIAGSYHWLVKIPVMVSFFPKDMKTITKNTQIQNQQMVVEVQIGRVSPETAQSDGLAIERWRVNAVIN